MSLAELRLRTKACHEHLESRLQLFTSVCTLEDYREHIYRFYRVLYFLERELPLFPEWEKLGVHWKDRNKCDLLRADLTALRASPEEMDNPEQPGVMPPFRSFPETVGSLYVIEGSTLGAQIISRHFKEKLGLTGETGMSFHIGYGPRTGERWKEFCAALERFFEENPESKNEAIEAACSAFTAIEEILCARAAPREKNAPRSFAVTN